MIESRYFDPFPRSRNAIRPWNPCVRRAGPSPGTGRRHWRAYTGPGFRVLGMVFVRLVVIGSDGSVSLAAIRWLADQGVGFSMLDRDGTVLATTGPVRPSDARLRRAQALAYQTGAAIEIARFLIGEKLKGQEEIARNLLANSTAAGKIGYARKAITTTPSQSTRFAFLNLKQRLPIGMRGDFFRSISQSRIFIVCRITGDFLTLAFHR